jgi:hypothetical protein
MNVKIGLRARPPARSFLCTHLGIVEVGHPRE